MFWCNYRSLHYILFLLPPVDCKMVLIYISGSQTFGGEGHKQKQITATHNFCFVLRFSITGPCEETFDHNSFSPLTFINFKSISIIDLQPTNTFVSHIFRNGTKS